MINRDSREHSYFIVRGEILGFMKDEQLRKAKLGLLCFCPYWAVCGFC